MSIFVILVKLRRYKFVGLPRAWIVFLRALTEKIFLSIRILLQQGSSSFEIANQHDIACQRAA